MIGEFLNKSWSEIINSNTIKYLIFVVVTLTVASLVLVILRKIATKLINSNADKIKVDPTNFSFLKNSLSFIIYFIALIIIFRHIPALRSFGSALFAGAGILAAIIGFASQKAFSNIITGIFILIFKPYRVGDVIEISNGRIGTVEEITLRHTIIKDFKNERIIVPNTVISDDIIINSSITDSKIQCRVEVGISYDSDIDLAMQIMRNECEKHPLMIDNRTLEETAKNEPIVKVAVIALADFSVNLRASAWTESFADAFQMRTDLLKIIKERFDREGIEIPFPYRTIVYKKDIEKK
ncbi:MAG: mechanosensitive ion channel family protein [Vicingaceae bacterium]|mgnify:CR=1 FL=1|jgi:small-conductance mechanosensitive channel|nr:mechanosensitive ion channel family protein [Flavobacteriales bacterium]MBQ20299.1 mechanosensitive ion channel protein MscS [Flavobacteriales bacterium]MDF1674488.1 mechanosensitive ion channel family protein [Vicingaceae bacterium]|tara:strand:+ start:193929 stop:194816 length:888 start_codon:yes stop_codon:yes gene_type:complete